MSGSAPGRGTFHSAAAILTVEEKVVPRSQVMPSIDDAVGRFHAWWRGDVLPDLPILPRLVATVAPGGMGGMNF